MSLSACQLSIVQQLTNTFENSQFHFAFDYCENIQDGRGYTSGIIGFTTGTKDAFEVIQSYQEKPQCTKEFNQFMPKLQSLSKTEANTDDVKGLEGYCNSWTKASFNGAFRETQLDKMKQMYLNPALEWARKLSLQSPLAIGQLYDTAVQHGVEGKDGLEDIIKRTRAKAPSRGGRESKWLKAFLKQRKRVLCHPHEKSSKKAWCESKTRVDSYLHALDNQMQFSDRLEALDNDGKPIQIKCNLKLEQTFIPSTNRQ